MTIKSNALVKKIMTLFVFLFISFTLLSCQKEPYYITWVSHSGEVIDSQYVESNVKVVNPNGPYVYGYRFEGWEKEVVQNSTDIIFVAKYQINEYVVTFKDDAGKIISIQNVKHGSSAIAPKIPIKLGFEFTSWNKEYSNILRDTVITANFKKVYSQNEIYNLLKESVFKVEILDKNYNPVSQGSGFFVKEDGTFITNAHVIKDAWYGRIDQDTKVYDIDIVEIITYNSVFDYAILKVENLGNFTKFKPVSFSTNYEVGETVYSIGYPKGSYTSVITKGKILKDRIYDGIPFISTDANIKQGSSGGVTVNRFGQVIGITTISFGDGTFGTLPARIFENKINTFNIFPKSIKDYFHPSKTIFLNTFNFNTYFNVSVINTRVFFSSTSMATVYYQISIIPKLDFKASIGSSIFLTLSIKTNYTYSLDYSSFKYNASDYKNVYITLYRSSNYTYYYSTSSLIYRQNLKSIDNYSWDFSSISGSIVVYQ